jgi:GNAT superfamily N-acetyltransferase
MGRMTSDATPTHVTRETTIISADHPSYSGEINRFLDTLRSEPRYFGPSAKANPKPFPSLIEALGGREGFRIAAVEQGRIVGLARVNGEGELFLAVVAERRAAGIGAALGRACLDRAAALHYDRIVMRSTRRSRAAHRVAEQLGCLVIDRVHGRTDLVLAPLGITHLARSA